MRGAGRAGAGESALKQVAHRPAAWPGAADQRVDKGVPHGGSDVQNDDLEIEDGGSTASALSGVPTFPQWGLGPAAPASRRCVYDRGSRIRASYGDRPWSPPGGSLAGEPSGLADAKLGGDCLLLN